jgi:hypothetical protein
MKCTNQKDNIEHLRKNFEEILNAKDDLIQTLFNELLKIDLDHKRFQEAHIMVLDDIIGHYNINKYIILIFSFRLMR